MATTNRLFQDFISFTTDADPGSGGVTLSAPGLADLLVVADPDFIALTLDPREVFGAPEIVWVSAHTSSATTATIVRAREGTSARAHDVGTVVIASLTADPVAVFEHDYLDLAGIRPMTGDLAMGGFGIAGVEGVDPETDVTDDLGTADKTWRQLFVDNLFDRAGVDKVDVQNSQLEGAWAVGGNLDPITDVAVDLGNATFAWRDLYVQNIFDEVGNLLIDTGTGEWHENLLPGIDVNFDLGSPTLTWRRLYVDEIYDPGGTRVIDIDGQVLDNGTWQVDGALLPEDDNAHDLGSSAKSWQDLYVFNIKSEAGTQIFDTSARTFSAGTYTFQSGSVVAIDRNSRSTALDIASNRSDNNVDHASIQFLTDTSDGSKIVGFRASTSGRMGIKFYGYDSGNVEGFELTYQGHVQPVLDNVRSLGVSAKRWTAVWAVDGSINTSDEREKRNVAAIRYGLNTVMAIEPIEYEWKSGRGGKRLGFGAQHVQPIIPEAIVVDDDPDVSLGQNSDMMLAVLWNAVRELGARGR